MHDSNTRVLSLRQQALLAAGRLTGGDVTKTFTAEELLVEAWKLDKTAWGLREFEQQYPDSEKINKELNRRGSIGLVGQGLVERVGRMMYRMTISGLHEASQLQPADAVTREKADRRLEMAVKEILEHPVFKAWLADPSKPKYFREAGHFWGIAPGTPPKTVRERITNVEKVLCAAAETLEQRGIGAITEQRGRLLFDRDDIDRCLEFQEVLKQRFERDLHMLDPDMSSQIPTARG